jgi:hypothetical protein
MAQSNFTTYSMPLEVYFQSAIVRGVLVTNQDRLSNYFILREGEEVFTLTDATLEDPNGKPMGVKAEHYVIYMQQVSLIADLSPQLRVTRSGLEHLYVQKESTKALLGIGQYWIKGSIHLTPGGSIHDLLMAKTRFIPVTDATFVNRAHVGPRTFLVNRTLVSCLAALREDQ